MRWDVIIPVWGMDYVQQLIQVTLPAVEKALDYAKADANLIFYTDDQVTIRQRNPRSAIYRDLQQDKNRRHGMMTACHRHALQRLASECPMAFVNADTVLSIECFAASERHFSRGKRAIGLCGLRTSGTIHTRPPAGVGSRTLLNWAWNHKHPWTKQCTWPPITSVPTMLIFDYGPNVVAHLLHWHPFAIFSDTATMFDGKTIDVDLLEKFSEVHLVTDADEMSVVSMMTPDDPLRWIPLAQPMDEAGFVMWARHAVHKRRLSARHCDSFRHQIVIRGAHGNYGDQAIVDRMLERIRHV